MFCVNFSLSIWCPREQKEDDELKEIMEQKGFVLSPMSYDTRRERQNTELEAPLATMALWWRKSCLAQPYPQLLSSTWLSSAPCSCLYLPRLMTSIDDLGSFGHLLTGTKQIAHTHLTLPWFDFVNFVNISWWPTRWNQVIDWRIATWKNARESRETRCGFNPLHNYLYFSDILNLCLRTSNLESNVDKDASGLEYIHCSICLLIFINKSSWSYFFSRPNFEIIFKKRFHVKNIFLCW